MRCLVTGGAGFIGSNLVRYLLESDPETHVTNLDALTYAGNLGSLAGIEEGSRYTFVHGDICDADVVRDASRVRGLIGSGGRIAKSTTRTLASSTASRIRASCMRFRRIV